jgi:beta-lactamase superfamily II metal-dependent hydrolase
VPADNIYMLAFLGFLYVALFVFFADHKSKFRILAIFITIALSVSMVATYAESRMDKFRLSVLDVGQGQCVLIQSGNQCYMVDCGGGSGTQAASEAVRQLWSNGFYHIDGIILTHYDKDHVNGVEPFLIQMPAAKLYLPDNTDNDASYQQIVDNFYHLLQLETFPFSYLFHLFRKNFDFIFNLVCKFLELTIGLDFYNLTIILNISFQVSRSIPVLNFIR